MKREKFGSRLGFILVSAGCAIGLGNVYRFPIMVGSYGGAIFVLIYILFLIMLGIPVMVSELSVGRASGRCIATSFEVMENGKKWGFMKYIGFAGNYILMMFYTVISSWMVLYFIKYLAGEVSAIPKEQMGDYFSGVISNPGPVTIVTFCVIIIGFFICSLGLKNGVERITKYIMLALFALMIALAIYSCTLSNAAEGLKFYLIPSVENIQKVGILKVLTSAMGQSFFTLSVGIGAISIFGSYINKERKLMGEAVSIISLDTLVAIMSGLILFPACFTYNNGVTADAGTVGASFLFTTLSGIFNSMKYGRIVGTFFFLFMIFAALSTVIAVFENIMSMWLEKTKLSRKKIAIINAILLCILSLPCILGFSVWSDFSILGKGIMDIEDFLISNNLLPIGSLFFVLYCSVKKYGWGFNNFTKEVNTGKGLKFPENKGIELYMKYILPLIILVIIALSYI